MCYDRDANPPYPPSAGNAALGEDVVLTGTDGNSFNAYLARPQRAGQSQILIYPDINGLGLFYKKLALRFAEQGITALAVDFYGHSAGVSPRGSDFNGRDHAAQLELPDFFSDVWACLEYLRQGEGGSRSTFVAGFCIGGSLTLLTGTQEFGLQGLIPFYASRMSSPVAGSKGSVLEESLGVKAPVLGFFGSADQVAPVELTRQLDEQLDRSGVAHHITIYEGAPHGFFDHELPEFASNCDDAWRRILAFIGTADVEAASKVPGL